MRHYYINPEWLLSNTARQVYRTAATVTLLFFVMLVSVGVVDHVPESVLPLLKGFLLLGVLGMALTATAMEYFLFAFDTSSALAQILWFCAMLVLPIGPPLYCFFVYSRAGAFKKAARAVSSHG
jgi:hypothetical protein